MSGIKIPLESTWVNVINFLIFDITLISAVYYLTTDVMGRFNDVDLSSGEQRRLFLTDYPVIGGGLCSTRRFRAVLLLSARVVALLLILAANLTIEGESDRVQKTTTASVVTTGDLFNYTAEQFLQASSLRGSCWSTKRYKISPDDPDDQTVLYYGEIRDGKCEIEQPDVFKNAVKFDPDLAYEYLTLGDCPKYETRTYYSIKTAVFFCENGHIQCRFDEFIPERVDLQVCRSWFKYNNTQYISGEGAAWPLMPLEPTDARRFEGLDLTTEAWFPLLSSELYGSAFESVHMVYGSGLEPNKTVKKYENVNITIIRPFWFVALGLKLLLLFILTVTSLVLWNMDYTPVAHDEKRLAELLRRRLEENDPRLTVLGRDDTPSIYLNADIRPQDSTHSRARSSSRVRVYAAGRPGASHDLPRISGSVNQSDPNYQAHVDEAAFY